MQNARKFYINGQWVDPIEGTDFDVINPSTEEVCETISLGGQADADAAVAAAKTAFATWSQSTKEQRIKVLKQILELYQSESDEMAGLISVEMGAPMDLAKTSQVGIGIARLKTIIRAAENFEFDRALGEHSPTDALLYEPVGVCALITPWNWPMNQTMLKIAPAIAAGCTMVLKPSEQSPLSAIKLAEIIDQTDLPAGVFNLVNGDGPGVGSQLTAHPDVHMVSFTGSTRAGIAISKSAADTIKRVSLELGGKGANIVFADADDAAVTRGARHCFNNTGQSCNAPTRMLVERANYEEAIAAAQKAAETTQVGDAAEEGRHIGPLVSEAQWNKVQDLIQKGIDEGARLVAGGTGRPEGTNRGYFVRPTVFADVTPEMTIWKEEIFGPVLSMTPFDSEEEAVEMANDTDYGLTNYVQSGDLEKARRVARQVRSGMVDMNGQPRSMSAPFGGMKQSGNGRENGVWGLEDFLEIKSVAGWYET